MSRMNAAVAAFVLMTGPGANAAIVEYGGSGTPVAHDQYVNVVSQADSPVMQTYVKASDGLYIATAIRKPAGSGPFPALIMFHGAPGGRGMEQLVGWSRGDHGGPVWERFLQEGFVVIVADYRGGEVTTMNTPSSTGLTTAIDDGLAVVAHVSGLPYVDSSRISLYGVSLGGNLVMYLASLLPDLQAVIAGAPAPIWFLGCELPADRTRIDFATLTANPAVARANITPVNTPILLQVSENDFLLPVVRQLHDHLADAGKQVRLEIYEHGYHDFVLGPQGQTREDLPDGEVLLPGALDALDRSVRFAETPPPPP